MLYKREEKKNLEMGEVCEQWGGNERKQWDGWGGMYVCGGEEEKKKGRGVHGWWEKKKGNKKEKWNEGVGFTCMVGKKGEWKRKKKKNLKGKKLNWFYLYVHFFWYKM